jgi:alkanesulfonate monooxygenase SsuD/methylene tetrahydromethanopterin reductase-like flavin-dependent oxidoreductase (luciferase family)
MQFGVFTTLQNRTWPDLLDSWRHVAATGWDVACVPDHLTPVGPAREGTNLEALSSLSALAALVPRIRLGTIVLSNTFRHPAVLAKMAPQIDIISGGRLVWVPAPAGRQASTRHMAFCFLPCVGVSSGWTRRARSFARCGRSIAAPSPGVLSALGRAAQSQTRAGTSCGPDDGGAGER